MLTHTKYNSKLHER